MLTQMVAVYGLGWVAAYIHGLGCVDEGYTAWGFADHCIYGLSGMDAYMAWVL